MRLNDLPNQCATEHEVENEWTWAALGPGLVTGAADDDPSGIATYASAGALFGTSLLWMAPVMFPLMACVEYICAKVGMVSGEGIAAVLREYYPRPLVYATLLILLAANTINAGTDIGAIASAVNLLFPHIPAITLIVPIGLSVLAMQLFLPYKRIASVFKWLTLSLLAYVATMFFVHIDVASVLRNTFLPAFRWDTAYLTMILAILGTTISPYCFFWQADEEVEEEISMGRLSLDQRRGASNSELKSARFDVDAGMMVSVVVMYFIMLTSASTIYQHGPCNIQTAADAAAALRPLAGPAAELLFALGIIGTGLLAIPVLTTSASYALAETFGWEATLDRKPWEAKEFYLSITASTFVGMLINFLGVNSMKALFLTAVLNGILAAPLLLVIMLIANDKRVMGERINGWSTNLVGGLTTALMFVAALTLLLPH